MSFSKQLPQRSQKNPQQTKTLPLTMDFILNGKTEKIGVMAFLESQRFDKETYQN